MASVQITIPTAGITDTTTQLEYTPSPRVSLGSSISADSTVEQFLGLFQLVGGTTATITIRLSPDLTATDPVLAGPDFSDTMEASGTIRIEPSHSIGVSGFTLNMSDISDTAEPYVGTFGTTLITARDAITSFVTAYNAATTKPNLVVTFDDGVEVSEYWASGDAITAARLNNWVPSSTGGATITAQEARNIAGNLLATLSGFTYDASINALMTTFLPIRTLTQTQYDAIATPDSGTVYIIVG